MVKRAGGGLVYMYLQIILGYTESVTKILAEMKIYYSLFLLNNQVLSMTKVTYSTVH